MLCKRRTRRHNRSSCSIAPTILDVLELFLLLLFDQLLENLLYVGLFLDSCCFSGLSFPFLLFQSPLLVKQVFLQMVGSFSSLVSGYLNITTKTDPDSLLEFFLSGKFILSRGVLVS